MPYPVNEHFFDNYTLEDVLREDVYDYEILLIY
jgi:hypothetical protein